MHYATRLPSQDDFFEIRFESIGGLGAHAAGQVLASAAVLRLNLNGAHFSSYGSEKKGSVVRSFVRLGPVDKPIRNSAPVESPDLIVVFHSALLSKPVTLSGLKKDGTLIYNAPPGPIPEELRQLPRHAKIIRVDALRIAVEEKSRANAVLLGTVTAALPFLHPEAVLESLEEEFSHRHPEAVAANTRAFRRGTTEYEAVEGIGQADDSLPVSRGVPLWGYETAPIGGTLPEPGNSIWNDLSTSRTGFLPVLDLEKCIHCAMCDFVCPDLCLVWTSEGDGAVPQKTRLMGVDYRYCKGCLRCVESCPTGALSRQEETPGLAKRLRIPLFPGLVT